jgi:uncharacterized protein YndB with AHSA1/START domain
VFEAAHSERIPVAAEKVWALWEKPKRWPEWNEQLASAELDGPLAVGTRVELKLKRGGRMVLHVTELEARARLVCEAKLIGCTYGHEQTLTPSGSGTEVSHRIYLTGPLSGAFSVMFGRRKMRSWVEGYTARERELTGR